MNRNKNNFAISDILFKKDKLIKYVNVIIESSVVNKNDNMLKADEDGVKFIK
jgi:hypothetical protein